MMTKESLDVLSNAAKEGAGDDVLADALAAGFSKVDLWNPDLFILRMVAEAHAVAIDMPEGVDRGEVVCKCLAIAAEGHGSDANGDPQVAYAIRRMAPLAMADQRDTQLARIGQLLALFSRYTITHPRETSAQPWRTDIALHAQAITDFMKSLKDAPERASSTSALAEEALGWIADNIGALWE